ncbi:hypothetical protein RF11_07003 [Thelohanellus kitauei]|uniref:Uncharacterized protein n=1 Tax=Thelohanellus kitauei TaxID=669202 RepID=A0A0C2MEC6_THEKT|nr:hypothetical protein RF11_07003 [Thelohanellus kitauei]
MIFDVKFSSHNLLNIENVYEHKQIKIRDLLTTSTNGDPTTLKSVLSSISGDGVRLSNQMIRIIFSSFLTEMHDLIQVSKSGGSILLEHVVGNKKTFLKILENKRTQILISFHLFKTYYDQTIHSNIR